jgi:Subtilase family
VSNAVAVAASRLNHAGLASYSNFSSQVKVIAPGGDVDGSGRYAMPALCEATNNFDCWQAGAGTSPATAMVSGAVASLSTVAPNAPLAQVEAALTTDLTDRLPNLAKKLTEPDSSLTRPALRVTASAHSLLGLGDAGATPPPPTPQPVPPPQPPVQSYAIGGMVSGLMAGNSLTLLNNQADPLSVRGRDTGDVSFVFKAPVTGGYSVTIGAQPSGQTCTVTNGAGTAQANVTSVRVTCTTNNAGGGTGDQAGTCVRYANEVIVCSGQSGHLPDTPAPPNYQLCLYSETNYGGRQVCDFWNGFDAKSYGHGDRVRSVRVRPISFDAQTGAIIAGEDVYTSGIFNLTLWPLTSRGVVSLNSSSVDVTGLLPRNARIRLLKIERASP